MDPVGLIPLARTLVDIDSTTGREGDGGRWLAAYLRHLGWHRRGAAGRRRRGSTSSRRSSRRRSSSPRTSTACRRSFRAASRAACCTAAARATRRAFWPRRSRPPSGCGARARRASACCSSSARSGAATARARQHAPAGRGLPLSHQRRADRQPARPGARAASCASSCIASGRAAHSSFPELGESAIDKLIDALDRAASRSSCPRTRCSGRTHYTVGLIAGGVAPNVVSPHAEAEVMFRTVGPTHGLEPALDAARDARRRSSTSSRCRRCD